VIHIHNDIYFDHDGSMNYLLLRRVITQPGKNVKPENIGEVRYDTLGYYPSLRLLGQGAAKVLTMEVLTDVGWNTLEGAAANFEEAVKQLPVFNGGVSDA
jgi:hypothetical protein